MTSSAAPENASKEQKKWTVMVFMGAATLEGNEPLIGAAEDDLMEMRSQGSGEARDSDGVLRGQLNIFVQVHQGGVVPPRRGRITENMPLGIDALDPVPQDQRDPARGLALETFIRWALAEADHDANNTNHHSMLVLWGHAYDFAIGREHTSRGMIDALDFAELSRVLERLQARFGSSDAKLDILGFDACDLATVEMACELKPFARFLLGSQISIPIPGWPYDRIFDRLRRPFGEVMSPVEFGTYVVRRFCEAYEADTDTVSLTLLHLERADQLRARAELLALMLVRELRDPDTRDRVAYMFKQSQTAVGKPFVDVADLCLNLVLNSADPLLIEVARALGNFLISPHPPLVGQSDVGEKRPFVVEHGRNSALTARLNGISLYAPHVALEIDFDTVRPLYQNFSFAKETPWSELVHTLARLERDQDAALART